ncbi:MAG: SGNH/GDSL hydrolase family protein, partial [Pseudomonadota bacterium]
MARKTLHGALGKREMIRVVQRLPGLVAVAAITLISLASVEAVLRLQQIVGPIYDLKMDSVSLAGLSEVVNHRPVPGTSFEVLQGEQMFGKFHGYRFSRTYNELGIRVDAGGAPVRDCQNPKKVLFLGDSFIEGYDSKNSLPYRVAARLAGKGLCIVSWNAGMSSYSPAIFVPQARRLLPQLKPDYVVVSIDETDLFDDNARYKALIRRDDAGRNIGVRYSMLNYIF